MIDRRLIGALCVAVGLGAGWFVRGFVAPANANKTTAAALENGAGVGNNPGSNLNPNLDTQGRAAAFDSIYNDATWGKNLGSTGTSGYGSMVKTTIVYRAFLESFMKEKDIHSVVDAGCGDWEFSQVMDWTGIDYKGYDIVAKVVEADTQKFGKPNIQFFTADIIDADLPPADLLVSKDVMQHLPNADVQKFLAKQLPKYKHILLTNGTTNLALTAGNRDIKIGDYRPIDLTRPPFNVPGMKLLTYWDGQWMHQALYIAGTKK